MAVYGQPCMLAKWFELYEQQSEWYRDQVEVIVVDDCGTPPADPPAYAKLYRVTQDIPWNQPGARNLAAMHATAPVLLLLDPDMTFPEGMLGKVLSKAENLPPGKVLEVGFKPMNSDKLNDSSPNIYLLHKQDFMAVKGYDEDYCGHKGWSDVQLKDVFIRLYNATWDKDLWLRLHHGDASIPDVQVTSLNRSYDRNRALRIEKRDLGVRRGWRSFVDHHQGRMIRFPWIQVR